MHRILEHIEGQMTEITQDNLDRNFGLVTNLDCNQQLSAVFHMLNHFLTGEAHKELSDHESAEGLEVWRAITMNLTDKGPHKRATLLNRINSPPRAKTMQGVRAVLKEWEKHLREYHATGGPEYKSDEVKIMLLRRILPCDEKRRLTHREFVEGAVGTKGETYEQLRQRILETITREELETQARVGSVLNANNNEEEVYEYQEENGEEDEDGPMEE